MAPEAVARGIGLALAVCGLLSGCVRETASAITVTWAIEPSTPVEGVDTAARITLQDRQGRPVSGARLALEAHMAHPGMRPVVGAVRERGGGEYEAHVQFSMAGDWVLVLTGELPDGRRLTRQLDVPGVLPAG